MNVPGSYIGRQAKTDRNEALRFGLALLLLAFISALTQFVGGRFAATAAGSPVLTQAATHYAITIATLTADVVLVLVGLWLYFQSTRWGSFARLGLVGDRFHSFVDGVALAIGALVVALAIAAIVGILEPDRIQFPGPWPTLLALAAATHAAVVEEIAFRSLLLQGVEILSTRRVAIIATGVLFTLGHLFAPFQLTPAWWVVVATAGFGLAWIFYGRGRNLWLPIGLHLGFDLGVFLMFGLPGETRGAVLWRGMTTTPALTPEAGLVLILATALIVAFALGVWRKRSHET